MIRKIGLLIGVAACGALVTSCGGDDTPEPTPTPTDTSTATPTPTPTPTSGTLDFDFTADFNTTTSNTSLIVGYFTPDGGMETFNAASRVNGTSGIDYVASPNSVLVAFPELDPNPSFEEADLTFADAMRRTYENGDASLELDIPFEYILRVMYELDDQPFTRDTVDGTLRSQRYTSFFVVSDDDTDIAANIDYTGDLLVVGGEPGTTASDALSSPQATVTITPGTDDTVSGSFEVFETVGGVTTQVADIDFSTTLNANNSFSVDLADATFDLEGTLAGVLVGPDRDEMFIVFTAFNADDDRIFIGNFIGD